MGGAQDSEQGVARCNRAIKAIAITLVVVPTFFCTCAVLASAPDDTNYKTFMGLGSSQFCLQLSFLLVILWLGDRGKGLLDRKFASLERLSVVNGCSDELTYVPFDHLKTTFDEAQS